jgi:hypothetical protein
MSVTRCPSPASAAPIPAQRSALGPMSAGTKLRFVPAAVSWRVQGDAEQFVDVNSGLRYPDASLDFGLDGRVSTSTAAPGPTGLTR